jgi:hypothetical protein
MKLCNPLCAGGLVATVLWLSQGAVTAQITNLALGSAVTASSTLDRYAASNAVDGVVSDNSRWLSQDSSNPKWIQFDLGRPQSIRSVHVYSGYKGGSVITNFSIQIWKDDRWSEIASVSGNTAQAWAFPLDAAVVAQRVRLTSMDPGHVRLRELALFPVIAPLGTGVRMEKGLAPEAKPWTVSLHQHLIALNQVGFETKSPKRFTAPVSPDGSGFEIRRHGAAPLLFRGSISNRLGDFTAFEPNDTPDEYVITLAGGDLAPGKSDRFAIRDNLWQEQFWPPAVDFMIDCRSVLGTHPSAYGGCPWRDGTYYDFAVPSLVLMYLADPAAIQAMPRQVDWARDKARVLSPDFRFDAGNPCSEGVMEAVRRYFQELKPPSADAPDVLKLVHWGLGYYLMNPSTKDPSSDPLPRQIHGQTVEQFAYLLYAWPHLKQWLPETFYERCRNFAFAHWKSSGLLEVDPLWDPKTYQVVADITAENPMGGRLHPYKGRHAPGHSIQPNLMMFEIARREGRADAELYLKAAQEQAGWIIAHLDWNDPRVTKGQRMTEFKTMTGLVWFLQHHADRAPAGLRQKITDWAQVMVSRSDNEWDFRRYNLGDHWTIPRLNEPGNLAAFTASAVAASWVVENASLRRRLRELAVAQMDNLFGRNPQLAAAPSFPDQGFPLLERVWPVHHKMDVCARIETTRGAICASPGSEKYPFKPDGSFRHAEGWVNFNAAWNVALAYWQWDRQSGRRGN